MDWKQTSFFALRTSEGGISLGFNASTQWVKSVSKPVHQYQLSNPGKFDWEQKSKPVYFPFFANPH